MQQPTRATSARPRSPRRRQASPSTRQRSQAYQSLSFIRSFDTRKSELSVNARRAWSSRLPAPTTSAQFDQRSSKARRSRLVGRPDPRARASVCWIRCCRAFSNSLGGVRSWQNCPSSFAPTRLRGMATTQSVRTISPCRTTTCSPGFTSRAGLATWPLTVTLPARQASLASARVRNRRTAQSQRSSRAAPADGEEGASEDKTAANLVRVAAAGKWF